LVLGKVATRQQDYVEPTLSAGGSEVDELDPAEEQA